MKFTFLALVCMALLIGCVPSASISLELGTFKSINEGRVAHLSAEKQLERLGLERLPVQDTSAKEGDLRPRFEHVCKGG